MTLHSAEVRQESHGPAWSPPWFHTAPISLLSTSGHSTVTLCIPTQGLSSSPEDVPLRSCLQPLSDLERLPGDPQALKLE